ncbi:MAG: response regulator [Bacteroidales bacterium]|nr:response regulator [Bacteroidales bacterium]
MCLKKSILLFILVAITFGGFAQNKRLHFHHITTREDLPHEYMYYSFLRDSRGFLWLGSEVGLHRYDGKEFTNYYNSTTDTTSFAGRTAFCLMEDAQKRIWVASNNGVDIFDRETNSFKHVFFVDQLDSTRYSKNNYSLCVYQTRHNEILVSTADNLFVYDQYRNVLVPFNKKHNIGTPFPIKTIRFIFEDSDGILWLCTQENGLYAVNTKQKTTVVYKKENQKPFRILSNEVLALYEDEYGEIWVGTSMGVSRINKTTGNIVEYTYNPLKTNGIPNPYVNAICEDKEKRIWMSTDGGGLALYDRDNDCFVHFNHNKDDDASLMSDKISKMYIDSENIIWVSTIGFGTNYADLKNLDAFCSFINMSFNNNSLAYNVVTAITEDDSGNLWIGTDGGGLDYYNKKTKTFTHYTNQKNNPHSLPSNSVVSLLYDSKKILWVGTYLGGLSMFDKVNNRFVNYLPDPSDPNGLKGFSVYAIKEDIDGNLMLGGHQTGLLIFNREEKKFSQIKPVPNDPASLASDYCLSVLIDSKGFTWIGTYNGLSCWDRRANKFINYYHYDSVKGSISNNWIYCILEDSKKNLWFGTAAGLNKFNRATGKFHVFNKNNGFLNDVINGIVEDSKGNLWLSTLKGIIKFNPTTEAVKIFDISKGLPGNEFMKCAYYESRNGEVFFGSTNGLVCFFPDSVKQNTSVPPVFITDFLIGNKKIPIGTDNSPLKRHISETEEIILDYDETFITFKYVALNYLNPEKNQYAYFLEGFDKEWHYVGNETKATYSSLNPGEYTFRVRGSNNDGIWNDEGDEVSIIVLSPWWQTWWFRSLVIMFLLVVIILVHNLRLAFYRRQQITLTRMVKEKTRSLEETTNFLKDSQEEIIVQRDKLEESNTLLLQQKQKILEQNLELDRHRNKLENLIEERTMELEKALFKAEESDKLKSSFLKNMSHEIRTPLNAIVGFTNLILEGQCSEEDKMLFGSILFSSTASLIKLIDDVLDISRMMSGELELNYGPVNINALLGEIYERLKQGIDSLPQKEIRLITTIPPAYTPNTPLIIRSDFLRLKQIVLNLTDNALKYTEKGFIEIGFAVTTEAGEKTLRIFVKDSGIGIQKEHQNIIFESFRKIEVDNRKLYRGIGLGLTISSNLANMMKGKLDVSSTYGTGSEFSLSIPFTEHIESRYEVYKNNIADPLPVSWNNLKILIVDDEMSNLYYAELILRPMGAKIYTAKDGSSAIEMYIKEKPDIVLMDIKMPGISGIQVMHSIREIDKNAVIIAQTAFGMPNDIKTFTNEGFNNCIIKPFSKDELIRVIRTVV